MARKDPRGIRCPVQTALGRLTLERAYYHGADCGQSFFPRHDLLGMAGASLSPAVTRRTGSAAALVSFAEASNLPDELAGVRVESKHVERAAEALGRAIADDERAVLEPAAPSAPILYLGMDGAGVAVRKEAFEGRPGQPPDGSAKTREVKLTTVCTAETIGKEGRPMRAPGSVTCSAAIESAACRDTDRESSEFARLRARAAVRGAGRRSPLDPGTRRRDVPRLGADRRPVSH